MAKPASGMYKSKARNLTDAQLKRAKGAGAAAKREVSVSDTRRETGTGVNKGYTLSAGGKRLTGTVIMSNGDRAVYKGGKRVTNAPKASAPKGGGVGRVKTKTTGMTAAQKAAMLADKKKTGSMGTKLSSAQANKMGSEGPKRKMSSKTGSTSTKGKNWYSQGGGGLFGKNSPFKGSSNSSGKPNQGDRRRNPNGSGIQVYQGARWISAY